MGSKNDAQILTFTEGWDMLQYVCAVVLPVPEPISFLANAAKPTGMELRKGNGRKPHSLWNFIGFSSTREVGRLITSSGYSYRKSGM